MTKQNCKFVCAGLKLLGRLSHGEVTHLVTLAQTVLRQTMEGKDHAHYDKLVRDLETAANALDLTV